MGPSNPTPPVPCRPPLNSRLRQALAALCAVAAGQAWLDAEPWSGDEEAERSVAGFGPFFPGETAPRRYLQFRR